MPRGLAANRGRIAHRELLTLAIFGQWEGFGSARGSIRCA
jgi:hypothetical protein